MLKESFTMSLVAYDSSDESDDSGNENGTKDEGESTLLDSSTKKTNSSFLSDFQETSNDQGGVDRNDVDESLLLKLPTTLHSVTEKPIIDFDIKGKKGLFSTLPPPKMKNIGQLNAAIEEETPRMLNKHQINKKETVKITLPALSQKSSGLFALLPAPKHMTVKEAKRNLVPNAVSKKPTKTSNLSPSTPKPKTTAALINYVDSGDDSDENNDGNFFSLNDDSAPKTAHLLLNATSCSNETLIHSGADTLLSTGVEDSTDNVAIDQPSTFCSELHPNTLSSSNEEWQLQSLSSTEMKDDILLDEEATLHKLDDLRALNCLQRAALKLISHSIPHDEGDEDEVFLGFDNIVEVLAPSPDGSGEDGDISSIPYDTAPDVDVRQEIDHTTRVCGRPKKLQRLCGRRATRGKQAMQIIDVSGDAIMPDPNEWLTKQLTEEQQQKIHSHSHRKNEGPTTQQRRKHQITYLAFQKVQERWIETYKRGDEHNIAFTMKRRTQFTLYTAANGQSGIAASRRKLIVSAQSPDLGFILSELIREERETHNATSPLTYDRSKYLGRSSLRTEERGEGRGEANKLQMTGANTWAGPPCGQRREERGSQQVADDRSKYLGRSSLRTEERGSQQVADDRSKYLGWSSLRTEERGSRRASPARRCHHVIYHPACPAPTQATKSFRTGKGA
uniref:(California timema) hypothetical protein n=1 Tax=Timema californicum TaxID=61474 RepID=A0A7R9J1L3_TIMCA|nr:unnamed protein product [Timema californicum]